ncbi:uncharacterized protein SCHCODRAFT_02684833 [Schizophyllum commune H4-8]|nr:uncharacterized protein SCHCODRAFT_02684833 [Schizophyllum commune H4-8]KAI5898647.1 hypothetical protein SCHCODRAFT_02684833 [Schizophyllum commune H4-8]
MPKDIATPSTKKTRTAVSILNKSMKTFRKTVKDKFRHDNFNVGKNSRFAASAVNARLKEAEDELARFTLSPDAAGAKVADEPTSSAFATTELVEALPVIATAAADNEITIRNPELVKPGSKDDANIVPPPAISADANAASETSATVYHTSSTVSDGPIEGTNAAPIIETFPTIATLLDTLIASGTIIANVQAAAGDNETESPASLSSFPCAEAIEDPHHQEQRRDELANPQLQVSAMGNSDMAYSDLAYTNPATIDSPQHASSSITDRSTTLFNNLEAPVQGALEVLSVNDASARRARRNALRKAGSAANFGDIPSSIVATEKRTSEDFDTFQESGSAVRNRACQQARRHHAGPGYKLASARRRRAGEIDRTNHFQVCLNPVNVPIISPFALAVARESPSAMEALERYRRSVAREAPVHPVYDSGDSSSYTSDEESVETRYGMYAGSSATSASSYDSDDSMDYC